MTWTYAQVKAADAALSPPLDDPAAAALTLNAQASALTSVPFTWSRAKAIARTASTGDWSKIVARSRLVPSLPPATTADAAILAAINAIEGEDNDIIDPTNLVNWTAFQAGLIALSVVGDVTQATIAAITALTSQTVPAWQPPLTAGDIQTARAQP